MSQSETRPNDSIFWISFLRFLCIIAVVFTHVVAGILYLFGKIDDTTWWIGNVTDSAIRFAVPVFVCLSGALVFSKEYTLKEHLQKRFTRILYPFIFWCAVYIAFKIRKLYMQGDPSLFDLIYYLAYCIKDGVENHLWFMYMLMGLYLIFPIFSRWIAHSSLKEISYYLAIWGILLLLTMPPFSHYMPVQLEIRYFTGYLGYAILGYFLMKKDFGIHSRKIGIVLYVVGFGLMCFGTYWLSARAGTFDGRLYDGLSPVSCIMSVGIFLAFKGIDFKQSWFRQAVEEISNHSFGIYLNHILVLVTLYYSGISWRFSHPALGILVTGTLVFLGAYLLVKLVRLLPFGKKISG